MMNAFVWESKWRIRMYLCAQLNIEYQRNDVERLYTKQRFSCVRSTRTYMYAWLTTGVSSPLFSLSFSIVLDWWRSMKIACRSNGVSNAFAVAAWIYVISERSAFKASWNANIVSEFFFSLYCAWVSATTSQIQCITKGMVSQ